MKGAYDLGHTVEHFSCDAGPVGWRYWSRTDEGDTLDLTTDDPGRVRRLLAEFDGWQVKGGAVGGEVLWLRGEDEHRAEAAGFTGASPAYDVAVARMLGLTEGQTAKVTLVELTHPVGAARTVTHGWARVPSPDPEVQRFEVADLATAERWTVNLAGDVVVSRDGARPAVLRDLTR